MAEPKLPVFCSQQQGAIISSLQFFQNLNIPLAAAAAWQIMPFIHCCIHCLSNCLSCFFEINKLIRRSRHQSPQQSAYSTLRSPLTLAVWLKVMCGVFSAKKERIKHKQQRVWPTLTSFCQCILKEEQVFYLKWRWLLPVIMVCLNTKSFWT